MDTTSRTGHGALLAAIRRKFPHATRRAIEVFQVDGSPTETEYRAMIIRPGEKAWSTARIAGDERELLLQLSGPPVG